MLSTDKTIISYGDPIMAPSLIPVDHVASPACVSIPFLVDGKFYEVTAMSFGTPHGAIFVDDLDTTDVTALGPLLGKHSFFPIGASIVFIQVVDKWIIKARLWQLDEGEKPFTHEAVCVAGTAAMACQKVSGNDVTIFMGGEAFSVSWNRSGGEVTLAEQKH